MDLRLRDGPMLVGDQYFSSLEKNQKPVQESFPGFQMATHQGPLGQEQSLSSTTTISLDSYCVDRGEVKVQHSEEYELYHYGTTTSGEGVESHPESLDLDADDMFLDDGEYNGVGNQEALERDSSAEVDSSPDGDYLPPSLRLDDSKIPYNPGSGTMSMEIRQPSSSQTGEESNGGGGRKLLSLTSSSVSSQSTNGGSHIRTPPDSIGAVSGSNTASRRLSLYSAIGSLENASATSIGRIQNQAFAARDFCGPSKNKLIPPKNVKRSAIKPSNPSKATASTRSPSEDNESDGTPQRKNAASVSFVDMNDDVEETDIQGKKATSTGGNDTLEKPTRRRRKLKKVTIDPNAKARAGSLTKNPIEMFRPSSDAYTPRMGKKNIKYKPAEMRTPVQTMSDGMGSLSRPNFRDALRRVAMIIKQHVVKIEQRFEEGSSRGADGLFNSSMRDAFSEDNFVTPKYKCTMVRLPMARPGLVYGLKKVYTKPSIPTEQEIYEFGHQLFKSVQLSSECSIVCLIYVERLMEVARVPLVSNTWRPIFMCGLLLASKVWQDLSSWNIEFASVYPQFSLEAVNKLELQFLTEIKWDLYISSSLYAKYYFALRSILEKQDFRMRYNRMVGVGHSVDEALKVQQRSEQVKEEAVTLHLSRSM